MPLRLYSINQIIFRVILPPILGGIGALLAALAPGVHSALCGPANPAALVGYVL